MNLFHENPEAKGWSWGDYYEYRFTERGIIAVPIVSRIVTFSEIVIFYAAALFIVRGLGGTVALVSTIFLVSVIIARRNKAMSWFVTSIFISRRKKYVSALSEELLMALPSVKNIPWLDITQASVRGRRFKILTKGRTFVLEMRKSDILLAKVLIKSKLGERMIGN